LTDENRCADSEAINTICLNSKAFQELSHVVRLVLVDVIGLAAAIRVAIIRSTFGAWAR
jgi:hypothetical protein